MKKKSIKSSKSRIKKHESDYIHIPKPNWKCVGKFFLTIFLLFLNYFNFKMILNIWKTYDLGYVFAGESELINYSPKFADLIVLYPVITQYLLICFTIICFVSIFTKLKRYDEGGLIAGLIYGLIYGLISGLIAGLILGLIYGLMLGLLGGLILGIISGLILGLLVGIGKELE